MNIKKIVVHCSASPQGRGDDASSIHRWHTDKNWWGIGYHAVILEDGTIEQGRPLYWPGAHVRGYNDESVGVCLIGEGGDATRTQLESLERFIWMVAERFPDIEVFSHGDLDPNKSFCPGFDAGAWWRSRVAGS